LLHARSIAELEVHTAFEGAEKSVRDTLTGDVEHTVTMRQVVASFEGQRHVRAALVNEKGKIIVASEIAHLPNPAPRWFSRLMTPPELTAEIPINLPNYPCVVRLTSDPRSELAEIWSHAWDAFLTMLLFCLATMAVVWLALFRAVKFIRGFQSGLMAVANGSYNERMKVTGPAEFAAMAQGFNHMAERLRVFSDSNRRLQQQVQNVQEEERAGIARDLHDEVGPYLFAIQVDANALTKSALPRERELGREIRDAALHVQQHVKEILRQLRPVKSLDFGLETAIADLVAFWARRHPGIRFEPAVNGRGPGRRSEEAAYYIVQESISNAVRHGEPKVIRITVTAEKQNLDISVEDDGGGMRSDAQAHLSLGHMGLIGMEERVQALGGLFSVEERAGGGVCIRATLPAAREVEPA
jgi:two-component system sensor histidine kinase UhpB